MRERSRRSQRRTIVKETTSKQRKFELTGNDVRDCVIDSLRRKHRIGDDADVDVEFHLVNGEDGPALGAGTVTFSIPSKPKSDQVETSGGYWLMQPHRSAGRFNAARRLSRCRVLLPSAVASRPRPMSGGAMGTMGITKTKGLLPRSMPDTPVREIKFTVRLNDNTARRAKARRADSRWRDGLEHRWASEHERLGGRDGTDERR
jgi:hypothetical protein